MNLKSFVADFSELNRWIVPTHLLLSYNLPKNWKLMSVSEIVEIVDEKTKVAPKATYKLSGVKWYGEGIFHRETVKGKDISATYLTSCIPNAIIYNRLFAWKESFAVVPQEYADCYVSNEFPQFTVNHDVILPHYLYLFFISPKITEIVNQLSVGSSAVSRNRFKEEDFLEFTIPIPPLHIQEQIVGKWLSALADLRNSEQSLQSIVDELNLTLFRHHSQNGKTSSLTTSYFVVDWDDLTAWDTKNARSVTFSIENPTFVPFGNFAEEATELVRPSESPKKEWALYGVNNTDGVFFNSWKKGSEFNSPYKRIKKDWFFHNPTRSSVGSLGRVPEVPDEAITSPEYQVWRVKEDVPPGYIDTLISTEFFIQLIQFHRVGAVKQRLYVDNLLEIPIPEITYDEQIRIARTREDSIRNLESSRRKLEAVKKEIEAMILGEIPIS